MLSNADLPSTEEILEAAGKAPVSVDAVTDRINEEYFAAMPERDPEYGVAIVERFDQHLQQFQASLVGNVMVQSYCRYHMLAENEYGLNTLPRLTGENNQLVEFDVPHYRNHVSQIKNLITADRLHYTPQAATADAESFQQVSIAKHVLEYVLLQRGLETGFRQLVETALVLASAYVHLHWNEYSNPDGPVNPVTSKPTWGGDIDYEILTPFDVAHEPVKEYHKANWHIVRVPASRYEVAARLRDQGDPDTALAVLDHEYRDFDYLYAIGGKWDDEESDQIPILHFYHKRCAALPNGRLTEVTGDGIILYDGDLPFPEAPVYRLCPSEFIGTSIPISEAWKLLGLEEIANGVLTPILSKINALGLSTLVLPQGANWDPEDLGAMRTVYVPPGSGQEPKTIEFATFNQGLVQFHQMIEGLIEKTSHMNAAVQGQPHKDMSGSAMAFLQAQAITSINDLEEAYRAVTEKAMKGSLQLYQSLATEPMLVAIAGAEGEAGILSFKGDAISTIKHVTVHRSNPILRTTTAKQELANTLLKAKDDKGRNFIKSPEEYMSVVETGMYSPLFADAVKQMATIRREHEMILAGEVPQVGDFENYELHIKEHAALEDTYLKNNPEAYAALKQHMAETEMKYQEASIKAPERLIARGVDPLPPNPAIKQKMAMAEQMQGKKQKRARPGRPPNPPELNAKSVDNNAKIPNAPNQPNMPKPPGGTR